MAGHGVHWVVDHGRELLEHSCGWTLHSVATLRTGPEHHSCHCLASNCLPNPHFLPRGTGEAGPELASDSVHSKQLCRPQGKRAQSLVLTSCAAHNRRPLRNSMLSRFARLRLTSGYNCCPSSDHQPHQQPPKGTSGLQIRYVHCWALGFCLPRAWGGKRGQP